MAYCTNSEGQLDWQQLEPGEQIALYTGSHVYQFEMDSSGENLILITKLSSLPPQVAQHIRKNRNLQEVHCGQDIDMEDMVVYFRTTYRYIGTVGTRCILYIRLVAKAPCASWEQCESMMLADEIIKRIEPLRLNEPLSA